MFNEPAFSSLAAMGAIGAVAGLLAGVVSGSRRLIGPLLIGVLGAIAASAIARIAGAPGVYSIGGFSTVWAAGGGFVLAFAVGRVDRI